ncbi:hypothetical protein Enr13x_70890 [Stieleria neptunia]|uniref:Putative restriction endonuclease domain-containing protein n=1 Tax=Stieleria neptunia TaxID=2527979 RepID=A0A518I238_9BACT|nr:Uma2 family endonuclease [Stieleria neptunia]QDV47180.1 hypothetical protein Enr13x_70890 [Stieleria neptunia]
MSAAPKYIPQYTVSDYLGWDGDWELWSGIPIAMSPSPFGRHQAVASRVAYELRKAIVVEVLSDATRERDLTFKQELYRDHDVGSYLVLDPADKSIVMWLRGSDRQWLRSRPGSQITLRVCEDCERTLDCGNLFP